MLINFLFYVKPIKKCRLWCLRPCPNVSLLFTRCWADASTRSLIPPLMSSPRSHIASFSAPLDCIRNTIPPWNASSCSVMCLCSQKSRVKLYFPCFSLFITFHSPRSTWLISQTRVEKIGFYTNVSSGMAERDSLPDTNLSYCIIFWI